MQLRHVVSCFLVHPRTEAVLLGRRSERVSTYPGRWAAISGSVDTRRPGPQALQEVREETGLTERQVDLIARGQPVRFADWQLGILWVVHPFRFRCLAPDAVRRDWEHVAFEWVDPARMSELPTVPRLVEAYEATWIPPGRQGAQQLLSRVAADRQHGAEELGLWTLDALRMIAASPDAHLQSALAAACRSASELRPSMAPVVTAALDVFGLCREGPRPAESEKVPLADAIDALVARREADLVEAAVQAGSMLPHDARVVTISHSFSVMAALRDAADHIDELIVAESRPACEGRRTAELAASFGVHVVLATDAAAAREAATATAVLSGVDSVTGDGTVVNKTGTFALCAAAARGGADVLAITTDSKVVPDVPPMEEMPADELGPPIPQVERWNVYFESIPRELIGIVVNAQGIVSLSHLRQLARRRSLSLSEMSTQAL
jgi:8-oxo-dGTP diphosphatase